MDEDIKNLLLGTVGTLVLFGAIWGFYRFTQSPEDREQSKKNFLPDLLSLVGGVVALYFLVNRPLIGVGIILFLIMSRRLF